MNIITKIHNRIFSYFFSLRLKKAGKGIRVNPNVAALHGLKHISVGDSSKFGPWLRLTAWDTYSDIKLQPEITIGRYCHFGERNHITSTNSITIGDHLLTGSNVLITDNSHGMFDRETLEIPPILRQPISKGPVVIGNNVWLGSNVCIMPGVTIGDGVVVGANSVVTKDIPSYSMAVGVPAQVIRQA